MTVFEIRPHRWGWKVFEVPGVERVGRCNFSKNGLTHRTTKVSKKCPSRLIFDLAKSTIYQGAGSSWIRTDDLLIASQSLSSKAGISVTRLTEIRYKAANLLRRTTTGLGHRHRERAWSRTPKSKESFQSMLAGSLSNLSPAGVEQKALHSCKKHADRY